MTLLPQGIRALEELDDELNSFEVGESLPCGFYCCGGGMDGVAGGVGSFCNCMSCGGECFAVVCTDCLQTSIACIRGCSFSLREFEFQQIGGTE